MTERVVWHGGKRYDLVTAGWRLAHAAYFASHGTDEESAINFAMDLPPLTHDAEAVSDLIRCSKFWFSLTIAFRLVPPSADATLTSAAAASMQSPARLWRAQFPPA